MKKIGQLRLNLIRVKKDSNMAKTIKGVLEQYIGKSECGIVHPETDVYHPNGHTNHKIDQALADIKRIIEEAKPKDYPVCENNQNPDVSSWCNQCWTCSVRHNPELWDGIEIGIETFELNLLKALGE